MLLSAGRATCCCALGSPCYLVLAVLCTAVHVFCWPMLLIMLAVLCAAMCCCVLVGPCRLVLAVLCACWPMLLSAGRAVCLLAHAA